MTPASLQRFLAKEDMNQREFARLLGVSPNTVGAWLRGKSPIKPWVGLVCAAIAYDLKPLP